MARLTLVLGGVRSGKSRWAERLAERNAPVTYLATAQAGDAEMAARIAAHRERRPASWRTIEEPWDVAAVVARHGEGCLLLECVPLWLTNRLGGCTDAMIRSQVAELIEAVGRAAGRVIAVSNETGCGIMPVNALARRFGDLLGEANQHLAAAAADVCWCVAGIPVCIKGDAGMR
jgi:adenosylcobinamide kinase / adenosylcobinamide-phosphate guanylyltransferase